MIRSAALTAILSTSVFGAPVPMSDRKKGALIAQLGTALSAAILFAALVFEDEFQQIALLSALGTALLAATAAGMFHHLYLRGLTSVWPARGVFTPIFLAIAGVLGVLYLSFL